MTNKELTRTTGLPPWLAKAVVLLGLLFLAFIAMEYQRNTSLIEQNRALIAGSAKTRLSNNITDINRGFNWANMEGDYDWIMYPPLTYWFENGVQTFPWSRSSNKASNTKSHQRWQDVWSEVESLSASNHVNKERMLLLKDVKEALESNDKSAIKRSFDAYIGHINAYRLDPQQEVAFSLKLVDIGAQNHWSMELVQAILLTGGGSQAPIIRPVVDLLFRNADLFSQKDFESIITKITQQLEALNISSYFLDYYLEDLKTPKFALPTNPRLANNELNIIANESWFLQRTSSTQISAKPFDLAEEVLLVKQQFSKVGLLDNSDSLNLNELSDFMLLSDIKLSVDKSRLKKDERNQLIYLAIKTMMLIAFVALVLSTLRLIEKNQQRRLEYLALREDFVKLVGHELKTPLAGIRAMAETLRKRIERGISAQAYPERIINEADKLWYMVDNILGFNRVQLSDAIVDKRPTKIKPMCDAIIEDVRSFSTKPYAVSNAIDESVELSVDAELFSLVVKNIIVNAGLYNDQATVEIELSFDANEPCLLISDNGIGVPEADRDKIFKPFVRLAQSARESVRQSGTGLGLAICKRIMQLHNGDLSLAQSNNHGSVWKISLAK